ncbi:YfhO family protein [Spongiivirga citrea]|uniref:YfhO family protein n=1 Tax=Spongiivirga citrea TaxID=1481457 RepID=A0A6M0CMK7_9FLAO|nr:YfhO family protein [Spongiivirga citrea]NER16697.1 YfhO family protein [Spongiivirga citrea]
MIQHLKKLLPHLLVLIGFIAIALAYFRPVLQGKQMYQSDIVWSKGMSQKQLDYREDYPGEELYWTDSAFGGMPTYQLGARYPHDYIKAVDRLIRFLPRPADYLFVYFFSCYILLLVLKIDWRLAILGALAFGFSTYLLVILEAGHNAKAHAIGYMPLVLAGILLAFRKKYLWGGILTAVGMGLQIHANHYQMTYYLLLLVLVLGAVFLIDAFKKKELPHFFKTVGVLSAAVVISLLMNATPLMATKQYADTSTRGKSELTIAEDGSKKEVTDGLDKDYILEYNYGIFESLNLFASRLMGGASYEVLDKTSETYDFWLKQAGAPRSQATELAAQTPTYWGEQPGTSGPAYVGAVMLFLFVLGLFLVKGRLKWWLLFGALLSLLLSYGKNMAFLSYFFIDYFPLYNKFRAVTSIQVILELCVPVLGALGLARLFNKEIDISKKTKSLIYAVGITAGAAILLLLFKGSLSFETDNDAYFVQRFGKDFAQQLGGDFINALSADRKAMYSSDVLRSLILVLLSGGVLWLFLKEKLQSNIAIIALGGLILFDLVGVDMRYVNEENFVSARQVNKPFSATAADQEILKDDSHYRVFDVTDGASRASYFHNSLWGYHAAKPGRYQELFDFYISKQNTQVINMLNVKYIIGGEDQVMQNEQAYGNVWFINNIIWVDTADEEMQLLDSTNLKTNAIVNKKSLIGGSTFNPTAEDRIELTKYKPDHLTYKASTTSRQFAVFSEMYYEDGWNVYVDGKLIPHVKVNYVLRGCEIPKGEHTIEFKFEPQVVKTGSTIALAGSLIFLLIVAGGLYIEFKKGKLA